MPPEQPQAGLFSSFPEQPQAGQPQPRRLPGTSHPSWPCPAARACGLPAASSAGPPLPRLARRGVAPGGAGWAARWHGTGWVHAASGKGRVIFLYSRRAEPNVCLVIGPEDCSIPISWSTAFYPTENGIRLVTRVRARMRDVPGGPIGGGDRYQWL